MPNKQLLTCQSILLFILFAATATAQRKSIDIPQIDSRFTLSVEKYFSTLGGSEEYYFYVQNNTSQEYKMVINVTLELACVGSKSFTLGVNKIVYLKPNGTFTPKGDWSHILNSGADNFKNCRLRDGDSYTLYKGIKYTITDVVNVTDEKNTADNKKKDTNSPNTSTQTTNNCNKDLPQVLLSEEGDYFWKLRDGSYKAISKEQYMAAKKLKNEPEKERFIQNCTGTPIIRLKANPAQQ